MTREQLEKLDAMAKPRSEEAIAKAQERKKRWLNVQTMTQEELIKSWVAYRGEANVTNDQLQAIKWAWETIKWALETLQMDEKKIDWEQRRYEIAKTMLPWLTTIRYRASADGEVDAIFCANDAIFFADTLIKQLKQSNK